MTAETITVLAPHDGASPLAKRIARAAAGGVMIQPCADVRDFMAFSIPVPDHDELAEVVRGLAAMPSCAVVRGGLTDAALVDNEAGEPIRRLLRDRSPREKATIRDVARSWLCIDIDSYPVEIPDLQHGPAAVVEEMVMSCLPAPFQARTVFWKLSSTSGFKRDVCSAHLWYWLEEPRTGDEVRRWFADHARDAAVDLATFVPNQLTFTADAQLVGVEDPLPQRSGWIYGDEDAVALPRPLPASLRPRAPRPPGEGVRPMSGCVAALSAMGDGEGLSGFHAPLRRAAMLYARDVVEFGKPRDDEGEVVLYQSAVEAAPCRDGRRGRYLSEHYLGALIEGAFRKVEGGAGA